MINNNAAIKKSGMQTMQRRKLIFYTVGLIIPMIQFLLLYVYVNIDSVLLCFQQYNLFGENAGRYTWVGFDNFIYVIQVLKEYPELVDGIWRSLFIYFFGLIQMPLHLLIAYYAVKKKPFAEAAHIIQYIPSILSGIVATAITKYFLCDSAPAIIKLLTGNTVPSLLDTGDYMVTFWIVLIDGAIGGLTSSLLIYAGTMNSIDTAVLEAAELDGVTPIQEWYYIYMPLIAPVVLIFIVMGLPGLFFSDIGLFALYGEGAPKQLWTISYFLTVQTKNSDYSTYPFLASFNMYIAAVSIPLTLLGRKLSNKITGRFE